MKNTDTRWLALSMTASFFAAGIPFWLVPYGRLSLPSSLLHPYLIVAVISALLVRTYGVASFWRSTFVVTVSVGAAVTARALVGIVQDSTSHNLWPLEVVIALMIGFACALAGSIVGTVIFRWLAKHQGDACS